MYAWRAVSEQYYLCTVSLVCFDDALLFVCVIFPSGCTEAGGTCLCWERDERLLKSPMIGCLKMSFCLAKIKGMDEFRFSGLMFTVRVLVDFRFND